jgi:hypothetical protein
MQRLFDDGFLLCEPSEVAKFILSCTELNKTAIGEYLGERDDFSIEVLQQFIRLLDFKNIPFVRALRMLLSRFRLPGESQKIERITEVFAEVYYEFNEEGVFSHPDTVFILSYSTIMLNTDLHNAQVKKKMTPEQFIQNNRGINQGADLPAVYLQSIYDDIQNQCLRLMDDDPFPEALFRSYIELVHVKKASKLAGKKRKRFWLVIDGRTKTFIIFRRQQDENGPPEVVVGFDPCVVLDVERMATTKVKFVLLPGKVGPDGSGQTCEKGWAMQCVASRQIFGEIVGALKEHTHIHYENSLPSKLKKAAPPDRKQTVTAAYSSLTVKERPKKKERGEEIEKRGSFREEKEKEKEKEG